MTDTFWADMPIPFQQEDGQFQFVNPVVVSQKFILSQGLLAHLGGKMETLTEEVVSYTIKLETAKNDMKKLRRKLLSTNYKAITKSASSEIQEAFVFRCAMQADGGIFQQYQDLETRIHGYEEDISRREAALDKHRTRQRTLTLAMEWATQYLNFEKHITRQVG